MADLRSSILDLRATVLWRLSQAKGHDPDYSVVRQLVETHSDSRILAQIDQDSANNNKNKITSPDNTKKVTFPPPPNDIRRKISPDNPLQKFSQHRPLEKSSTQQSAQKKLNIYQLVMNRLRRMFHIFFD